MELRTLNEKRGIYSFFNGRYGKNNGYIIYSSFYGVMAKSTKIIDDKNSHEVTIYFDICEWLGYWDLKSIITKGIKKAENQFVNTKVNIIYNTIRGSQNSLEDKYNFNVSLTKKYKPRKINK